jgi:hypothetical protein
VASVRRPPVLSLLAMLIHWGLADLVKAAASYMASLARGGGPTFAVSRATPVVFAQIVKRLLTERNFAAVSWSWRLAKTWASGRSDRALGSEFSHQPGPVPTARPPTAKAA